MGDGHREWDAILRVGAVATTFGLAANATFPGNQQYLVDVGYAAYAISNRKSTNKLESVLTVDMEACTHIKRKGMFHTVYA